MTTPADIVELARSDGRYAPQAYFFVLESLHYAQEVMRLGREAATDPPRRPAAASEGKSASRRRKRTGPERHLSGAELCEAIRQYALEQFGLMARTVFQQWRVNSTSDFGEIVFTMVEAGQMSKTPEDRREDFDGHYDFETGLTNGFRITLPEKM